MQGENTVLCPPCPTQPRSGSTGAESASLPEMDAEGTGPVSGRPITHSLHQDQGFTHPHAEASLKFACVNQMISLYSSLSYPAGS